MPKISIILAVYNVEKYLKECLDSLVNQTFSDLEIICVNDGSTDNSLKLLEEYAEKDSRVVIISQENQGPGIARNKAIEIANGEYTMFVDPDDWIELNACEILYNKLKETGANVIQFNYKKYYDSTGKIQLNSIESVLNRKYFMNVKNDSYIDCEQIVKKDFKTLFMAVWNRIYKTDFLRENKIRFAPTTCAEDNFFVISLMFFAKKIYFIDNHLYFYRIRRGSLVNRFSDKNFDVFENIKLIKEFLIEIGQFDDVQKAYRGYLTDEMTYHFMRIEPQSKEKYIQMCKTLLTEKEFADFEKHSDSGFRLSFLEFIFSVKNKYDGFEKYKTLTVLGFPVIQKRVEI